MSDLVKKFGNTAVLEEPKSTSNSAKEKASWYKMTDGKHLVRILPPLDGKNVYHCVSIHFRVSVDGRETAVQCTKAVDGRCPICDDVEAHNRIGTKESNWQAYQKSARPQYLFNVLDSEQKPCVLAMDNKLYKEFRDCVDSLKTLGKSEPWHPTKGMWLLITKKKGDKGNRRNAPNEYSIMPSDNVHGITVQNATMILDGMANLDELYKTWTYEDLEKTYFGVNSIPDQPPVPTVSASPSPPLTVPTATKETVSVKRPVSANAETPQPKDLPTVLSDECDDATKDALRSLGIEV